MAANAVEAWAAHVCGVECRNIASPEHIKLHTAAIHERGKRMCDNLERKDVIAIGMLGLSQKDLDNLNVIADDDGRIKNYAVLIRRMIAREAKACASRSRASDARSSVPSLPEASVIPGQLQIPH